MLNLFVGTAGSCSLASHITLEEAGATYKAIRLDMASGEHRKEPYLSMNPKARVPTLATDRGVITELPAILLYIGQTHPQANLAPADPFTLAQMQAFTAYLCSTVHPVHAHKSRGARWSDDPAVIEALKRKVPQNMTGCAAIIETEYLRGPWVMGSQFTIADPYLYTIASWMPGDGVDLTKFPKISAHQAAMGERPAVKKVLASYR